MLQVKNGSFTSLVFSVNGRMGEEASKCYGSTAENLTEKSNGIYSVERRKGGGNGGILRFC